MVRRRAASSQRTITVRVSEVAPELDPLWSDISMCMCMHMYDLEIGDRLGGRLISKFDREIEWESGHRFSIS